MMLFNKPLAALTEADLQTLIDNQVAEGKMVDFKEAAIGNGRDAKKEFLADVSSFANTAGGHLIIGMREKNGVATAISGLDNFDPDAERLRLENLLRTSIAPRISGIEMEAVEVATGHVIVISIPRSWAKPHVVNFSKHWRFYGRNSAGKYPLDIGEVRTAFILSETMMERIRSFRTDRVKEIEHNSAAITMPEGGKIVLHLIPLEAFDTPNLYSVSEIKASNSNVSPIYAGGWNHTVNFDGVLNHSYDRDKSITRSYVQLYRNGIVEAVNWSLLNTRQEEWLFIPSVRYEIEILKSVKRYLQYQRDVGIVPPIFLTLSLISVKGYEMAVGQSRRLNYDAHRIDRQNLLIPELLIEDYEVDVEAAMKPVLESVWNATGWASNPNYQEDRWVGHN